LAEATGVQGSEGLSSEQALRDIVTSCGNLLKFNLLGLDASKGFPPRNHCHTCPPVIEGIPLLYRTLVKFSGHLGFLL
jgi:hypothetical protein